MNNEYLEVEDENGLVKSLRVENATEIDGYVYFDSLDEHGVWQHYRVRLYKE